MVQLSLEGAVKQCAAGRNGFDAACVTAQMDSCHRKYKKGFMSSRKSMTRYLVDPANGRFWSAPGEWTDEITSAREFGSIHEAIATSKDQKVQPVDLVVRLDSQEVRIKLEDGWIVEGTIGRSELR
jgi:hypothetical protein